MPEPIGPVIFCGEGPREGAPQAGGIPAGGGGIAPPTPLQYTIYKEAVQKSKSEKV